MLELVLTKADLSSLTIVDAETVADSGSNPKKAYTLKNPGLLDAPGVYFDLPDTELDRTSLVPDWFYIGVYHPVRVGELMWFLDGYLRMFTPHAVSKMKQNKKSG